MYFHSWFSHLNNSISGDVQLLCPQIRRLWVGHRMPTSPSPSRRQGQIPNSLAKGTTRTAWRRWGRSKVESHGMSPGVMGCHGSLRIKPLNNSWNEKNGKMLGDPLVTTGWRPHLSLAQAGAAPPVISWSSAKALGNKSESPRKSAPCTCHGRKWSLTFCLKPMFRGRNKDALSESETCKNNE